MNEKVKVPFISGLILAKYSKAAERQIEFVIDERSYIDKVPDHVIEDDIASIIGNLIDNAIDALTGRPDARITMMLKSDEDGVTFIIKDNGPGIKNISVEKCFEKGVSTKGPDRGYGLFIVNERLERAHGKLWIENENGLICRVFIPEGKE